MNISKEQYDAMSDEEQAQYDSYMWDLAYDLYAEQEES